ncbi:uncharacterized protein LOC122031477 [Zingiber officinale]|nr:uncharacterized protein LOC122031477 [Zingiber officinale]
MSSWNSIVMQRRTPLFVCSMAVVAALLLLSSPASAQTRICGVIIEKLTDTCREYIKIPGPKVNPSAECCALVEKSNVPCLCDNLPPGIEETISLEKAFFVARKCGKKIRAGSKLHGSPVDDLRWNVVRGGWTEKKSEKLTGF